MKVSTSVNLGFVSNGWMSRGRGHAQMSVFRPRRTEKIGDRTFYDDFEGSCSRHHDCIEGLVSLPALAARFCKDSGMDPSRVTLKDLVKAYPLGRPEWIWTSRYIAQLVHFTTALIAPSRIAVGGLIFTGPDENRREGWKPFIEMVRDQLTELLFRPDGDEETWIPLPDYDEVRKPQMFLQYRSCEFPAVFGGLIAARWDKTGYYPTPVEHMLRSERREIIAD